MELHVLDLFTIYDMDNTKKGNNKIRNIINFVINRSNENFPEELAILKKGMDSKSAKMSS